MGRILIFLLVCLAASVGAQPLMTLEDAIELGLKNNFDIRIARNQAQIASNNKGKGLAGFLPTLDATAGYSVTDREQDTDPPPATTNTDIDNINAELRLNWTIFDGFRMFTNRSRYNQLASLGQYQARDRIENVIVAVSKAYFNLVLQEQLLDVAIRTRDISETRFRREKVRNELGGASSTDYLNARVAFNSDQSSLLEQELQVKIAREQLNVLLGQDAATEFPVSPEITIPELPYDFDRVQQMAQEKNSSLRAAELNKKIADLDVRNARSPFMPRLSAYAGYGYTDQTVNSDGGLNPGVDVGTETANTTFGLSLSFNLFNGRQDRINLQNAKIEATNQALSLRDARNRLSGLVRETFDTFKQRMAVYALESENIETARQNLELQQDRFDRGVATSLEFRDAQISYTLSDISLITARYQARISLLEIEQLIGALNID